MKLSVAFATIAAASASFTQPAKKSRLAAPLSAIAEPSLMNEVFVRDDGILSKNFLGEDDASFIIQDLSNQMDGLNRLNQEMSFIQEPSQGLDPQQPSSPEAVKMNYAFAGKKYSEVSPWYYSNSQPTIPDQPVMAIMSNSTIEGVQERIEQPSHHMEDFTAELEPPLAAAAAASDDDKELEHIREIKELQISLGKQRVHLSQERRRVELLLENFKNESAGTLETTKKQADAKLQAETSAVQEHLNELSNHLEESKAELELVVSENQELKSELNKFKKQNAKTLEKTKKEANAKLEAATSDMQERLENLSQALDDAKAELERVASENKELKSELESFKEQSAKTLETTKKEAESKLQVETSRAELELATIKEQSAKTLEMTKKEADAKLEAETKNMQKTLDKMLQHLDETKVELGRVSLENKDLRRIQLQQIRDIKELQAMLKDQHVVTRAKPLDDDEKLLSSLQSILKNAEMTLSERGDEILLLDHTMRSASEFLSNTFVAVHEEVDRAVFHRKPDTKELPQMRKLSIDNTKMTERGDKSPLLNIASKLFSSAFRKDEVESTVSSSKMDKKKQPQNKKKVSTSFGSGIGFKGPNQKTR